MFEILFRITFKWAMRVVLRSVFGFFNAWKRQNFKVLEKLETLPKIIVNCIY